MKKNLLIKQIAFFSTLTVIFFSLNIENVPLSSSLYIALIFSNVNFVAPTLAFLVSFARYKDLIMLLCGLFTATSTILIFSLYKKFKRTPSVESVFFILLSQIVFLLFSKQEIVNKLVYTAIITVFYFICSVAVRTIKYKNITAETETGEKFSVGVLFVVASYYFINLTNINVYKVIAYFILLFSLKFYKNTVPLSISLFLALPLAIYSKQFEFFALFSAIYFLCYIFTPYISIVPALTLVGTEFVFNYFVKIFPTYGYIELICSLLPAIMFSLIPEKVYTRLNDISCQGGDKLTRSAITSVKSQISGQVYELSNAFMEMQGSLDLLKSQQDLRKPTIKKITKSSIESACQTCPNYNTCKLAGDTEAFAKIIEIGLAKGRLTLVDFPKSFLEICTNPNPLIFEINRLIDKFKVKIDEIARSQEAKEVLSLSAKGLSEKLSQIAFNLSGFNLPDKKLEKQIAKHLRKNGIKTYGVLVDGNEHENISILTKNEYSEEKLTNIMQNYLDIPVAVFDRQPLQSEMVFYTFSKSSNVEASFGVSAKTKFSSETSGDVHSLIKLGENRFLVALSDGMGSGDVAYCESSAAIGLIEGMFKAGISSRVVLEVVNKLISISTEDTFSAIDMVVIDLNKLICDFIKIGAPYGFILSKEGIRYIEGSSLPIGILNELHPTTAHTETKSGDIIIMLSDGVTDAFGSSSDFIEFLKSAPSKNPQTLADSIIAHALELTNNVAEDDMTALCVRLFDAS